MLAALAILCSKPEMFMLLAASWCQGKWCRQVVFHFLLHTPHCSSYSFFFQRGQSAQPWAVAPYVSVQSPAWHPLGRTWFHTCLPRLSFTVFLSFRNLLSPMQFFLEMHLECTNNFRSRFIKITAFNSGLKKILCATYLTKVMVHVIIQRYNQVNILFGLSLEAR